MSGGDRLTSLPPALRRVLELAAAEPDPARLAADGVRSADLRRAAARGLLTLRDGRVELAPDVAEAVVAWLRVRLAAAAARLGGDPSEHAARLLAAAREARHGGAVADALALVEATVRASPDPVVRARARYLELGLEGAHGFHLGTYEALVTEAAAVEELEPALAARMYADAAVFAAQSDVERSLAAAERSRALAGATGGAERTAAALAVATAHLAAGDAGPAEELIGSGLEEIGGQPDAALRGLYGLGALYYYLEDYPAARRVLEHAVPLARAQGARSDLAALLDTLAAVDVRLGRYASAQGASLEALRLARAEGSDTQAASCLTTLAGIDAVQGRERRARARVEEALALVPGHHLVHVWGLTSLALLELGLGRVERVRALEAPIEDVFAAIGPQPANAVRWLPVLVETCVRLGRGAEAADALDRLAAASAELGPGWRAVAARCRALVSSGTEALDAFEEALELHLGSPRPFDRAWTELCYGERLRRSRRRGEARRPLESALATFERLRAAPWAERARRELGAATAGRRRASPADLLTHHERQVVALVTAGARNREAAAALFVTPKTIERHLTNVYAKLGVRSRTELARLFLSGY